MVSVDAAISTSDAGGGFTLGFLPTVGTYATATSSSTISLAPTVTVTSASYSTGQVTFNFSGTRTFLTDNYVTVTGATPSNYNGIYLVNSTGASSFTGTNTTISGDPGPYLSGGTIIATLCGSSTSTVRIGWENFTDGNLPSPRFAVEVDTAYNSGRSDPNNEVHTAIDFDGVTHGTNASICSGTSSTYRSTSDPVSTVTAGLWSLINGTTTYTTSASHSLVAGMIVAVDGATPIGFNGVYRVASVTSTTFTVAQANDPGSWSSGGTVTRAPTNYLTTGTSWSDSSGSGVVTFATSLNHNLAVGNVARITGASPSGFNGSYTVTSTPTSTTFTAALASNPGTWSSGGGFGGNDCYTGPSSTWLENGLTSFHRLRVEIEPMSAACNGTAPLLKYWLLPSTVCSPVATLTVGTSWSGGAITFRTTSAHGFAAGNTITVSGASPTGYNTAGNSTFTVATVPDSTTFTVLSGIDPGPWTSEGTPISADCASLADMTSQYSPTSFPSAGVHLFQCIPTPNPSNAFDSVYFGFTANNTSTTDTSNNFVLQNLQGGLISIP